MDIIYGTSLEYDFMLTILQTVYNDESFDINTGDYKQYSDDLNNYLKKNFKNFSLKIFSTALIEAENSNNFWTIGYHVQNIGYYSTLSLSLLELSEQIKTNIDKDYTVIGDNYYRHSKSYFPHCDAINEQAWLNIVIPLEQYEVFGQQKFVVFDQKWLGRNITWTGKIEIPGDFASNKKTNQRPVDSEFFSNGTGTELPQELWEQFNKDYFDKDYFYSMNGTAYDWTPGDIVVFESQHIHATGIMQSAKKLGLSIRIEKL